MSDHTDRREQAHESNQLNLENTLTDYLWETLGGWVWRHRKLRTTALYCCLAEKPYWSALSFLLTTLSSCFHPSITLWIIALILIMVSSFSSLCHALLHHNLSLHFLFILSVRQCFSQAFWGREPWQEAAWLPDNGTHQKAAPASPASHTHTHTELDKQDIPAAGCTGFLALANLKRRVRLGVERSEAARVEGWGDGWGEGVSNRGWRRNWYSD